MIARQSKSEMPIEWLAAYVDGELEPCARLRVESWLVEHPEALDELFSQENLSPANDIFWQVVAPPMPTQERWEQVASEIIEALREPAKQPRRWMAPVLVVTGLAACLVTALLTVERPTNSPGTYVPSSPLVSSPVAEDDEEAAYQIARADDVELLQLPEAAADLIVVGKHPLADVALVFASTADVQLLNYGFDDQGEVPDHNTMTGSGLPMFVAPPRKK